MNSDTVLWVIAVSAVFSPFLTSWLTNRHQERMRQAEMDYEFAKRRVEEENRIRAEAIQSLTTFFREIHVYIFTRKSSAKPGAMEEIPNLLAALDDRRRGVLMTFVKEIEEAPSAESLEPTIERFNTHLQDWISYIESKPATQLPEPPKFYKVHPILDPLVRLLQRIRGLIRKR